MSDDQVINFRFIAIHIVSKSLMPLTEPLSGIFIFEIKVEVRVVPEKGIVMPTVDIMILEDKTKKELANFKIACSFEIVDFDTVILKNEEGKFLIPKPLQDIIQPVSISTARGVVYSELRGTHLNNAIMPVVFMNSLQPSP